MWQIVQTASPQLIKAGLTYTIPIAVVSFAIGLVIALLTALIRLSQKRGAFLILKLIFRF